MNHIQPINDLVLIKRVKAPTKSAGGVLLPTATKKQNEGVVVATGPNVTQVAEGDRVIFGTFTGTEITANGQALLIIKEEIILAKIS